MNIYLTYGLIALIGTAISVVMIAANQSSKAKQNNVIFPWKTFWGIDLAIKVSGSILTALLILTFLPPVFKQYSEYKYLDIIVRVLMAVAGYSGSDLANRIFSVANTRVNAAISYKTTQTDIANGTVDVPTPAVKPIKSQTPDVPMFEKPAAPNDPSLQSVFLALSPSFGSFGWTIPVAALGAAIYCLAYRYPRNKSKIALWVGVFWIVAAIVITYFMQSDK